MPRRRGPSLDRDQVVQAAIACVETQGPEGLSISRVARRLGIKPPSLYNHVDGAEDLAQAVTIDGNQRLLAALRDAIHDVVAPVRVLETLAGATRRWALDNNALYRVMSQVPPKNEDLEFGPLRDQLLSLFQRPLAQLGIAGDDAIHAIRALRSATHGFVLLETRGQFGLDQSTEDSFAWLVRTTLAGLAASTKK